MAKNLIGSSTQSVKARMLTSGRPTPPERQKEGGPMSRLLVLPNEALLCYQVPLGQPPLLVPGATQVRVMVPALLVIVKLSPLAFDVDLSV
jgi:hypothetical protein